MGVHNNSKLTLGACTNKTSFLIVDNYWIILFFKNDKSNIFVFFFFGGGEGGVFHIYNFSPSLGLIELYEFRLNKSILLLVIVKFFRLCCS